METKKTNIWNLDQEFEQLCGRQIWDSLFGLNANNNMPSNLIENIGFARQEAVEIMADMMSDTNLSLDEKFKNLLNNFWDTLSQKINEQDFEKVQSIKSFIDAYIIHGLDAGFDTIKNQINLEQLAKTEWLDIDGICNSVDKYMDENFKNDLIKSLLIAIDIANYNVDNQDELRKNLIMMISDLNLFYTNICGISESIINDHGFVSLDVIENRILVTYQNLEKVGSAYDITNNLIKSLSLSIKKEVLEQ